jgi:hypothetical protein
MHAPFESTEQDDDVVGEFMLMSKADIEAVDKVPEESLVVGEVCTFGCFSPHARYRSSQPAMSVAFEHEVIDGILAPVMHIMPELQELLVEACPPPTIGFLAVSSTPPPVELNQPLDFVDGGEKVNEAATLTPNSEALFAKELCDLLTSLEVASPGSGNKAILSVSISLCLLLLAFCFCFANSFATDSFVRASSFWFLFLLFQRKSQFRLILLLLLLKPLRLTKTRMEMI